MDNENFVLKKIDMFQQLIKDAANRSRTVFLITTIACSIILVGTFNYEYTWMNKYNSVDQTPASILENFKIKADSSTLDKKYLDMLFDRYKINIPVLGMSISVFDLPTIGSISLAILAMWSFFSTRREHHLIDEISDFFFKINTSNVLYSMGKFEILYYLYHGTVQNFIFITPTKQDYIQLGNSGKYKRSNFSRVILYVLFFLPAISVSSLILSDIMDILDNPKMLKLDLFILEFINIICFIAIVVQCIRTYKLVTKSVEIFQEMNKEIASLQNEK